MANTSIYNAFERMWQHILSAISNAIDYNAAPASHLSDKNNPHEVTKAQVGLGNVDNTSDLDKPISTATQAALNTKADKTALTAHEQLKNNPHGVTADQVDAAPAGFGLGEEQGYPLDPDTIDAATKNGIYYYYDKNYNNLIDIDDFVSQRGTVIVTGNTRYKTQTFISNYNGKVAQRSYTAEDSGIYGAWRLAADIDIPAHRFTTRAMTDEEFGSWLNTQIASMPDHSMRSISTGHVGAQKLGFIYKYKYDYATVDLTEQGSGLHFSKVKNNGNWSALTCTNARYVSGELNTSQVIVQGHYNHYLVEVEHVTLVGSRKIFALEAASLSYGKTRSYTYEVALDLSGSIHAGKIILSITPWSDGSTIQVSSSGSINDVSIVHVTGYN